VGSSRTTSDFPASAYTAPRHPELVTDEPPATAIQDRRAPHPTCPVLRPAAYGTPLDAGSLWANSRAHRVTRVPSDLLVVADTRSEGDEKRGRTSGGVSERDDHGDQTQKRGVAHGPCLAKMTFVNLPEGANEMTDGMVRSLNATKGAGISPYRKSRSSCFRLVVQEACRKGGSPIDR
jgi:hypothetical protein